MINHLIGAKSHFSIGESTLSVKDIVNTAKEAGFASVALADTMSISGLVELTTKAKEAGIKPIIGVRLNMVDDPTYRKPSKASGEKAKDNHTVYPKVYAKTEEGLKRLMRLLTRANADDYFYKVPQLGWGDLLAELDGEHLLFTSGDVWGALHHPDALTLLKSVSERLGTSQTFLELCPVATPLWDTLNYKAIQAASELGLSCIVTYPAFYASKEDADTLDVLNAISRNVKLADKWANRPHVRDHHIKRLGELVALIKGTRDRLEARYPGLDPTIWKRALNNSETFADSVSYEWAKMPVSLPKMAEDEFATLVAECKKGWVTRFGREVFGYKPTVEDLKDIYQPRLKYELGVLRDMGFAGYFLLVQDLVMWSKRNDIAVGPGRGSVGGSLVAYLTGITDCDPIRFNLLFERFINPERLDLPDADLDFMSTRRHEVIGYLVDKYGDDRVAGISNYTMLGPASAVRDVARVLGVGDDQLHCTKLMPKEHGQSIGLEESAKQVAEIEKFAATHPRIWKHALKLEGIMRSLGRHAAGVVVGGEPLVNRAVVERRKDGATVNWDKRIVEDFGLVKMDILGLNTLDTIELAREFIFKRHSIKVDVLNLPLDDRKVLDNFAKGNTIGVFQFESGGMRGLLKNLGREGDLSFEDIAAATALYRPGPMDSGMMDQFVSRKIGHESVTYEHPNMQEALKTTYGVAVYQEQVMQLARDLAGFTFAEADHLRKAMGKKDKEKMAKFRDKWNAGCVSHSDWNEESAGALFDKIEAFAGYGFNRSHAVEYSLISYICMWLKTNYPAEFYAAALTTQTAGTSQDKENKVHSLIKDAGKHRINVVPPDINISTDRFEILNETTICIPFNALKGVSDNTAGAILAARKAGQFSDVDDFLKRVEKRKCNIRHQDILRRVGAFARIEPDSLPANHPDRLKDQKELMPGLIIQNVRADREVATDELMLARIEQLIDAFKAEKPDAIRVRPRAGKNAKFMVISDCPTSAEEKADEMTRGRAFETVDEALAKAGLDVSDGYWTALVKTPKGDAKQLSNEDINAHVPILNKEIELLKPPVIVCLGSAAARHFLGGLKGGIMDHAGKVVFDPTMDASIVIGISPGMVYFDESKRPILEQVFKSVAEMVS